MSAFRKIHERIWISSGSPVGVSTSIIDPNPGDLVIDTDNNLVFLKTTARGDNSGYAIFGHQGIPMNSQGSDYTTVLADAGKCIFHAGGEDACTWTISAGIYPVGTVIKVKNLSSAGDVTIHLSTGTLLAIPGGGTGNRTLGENGEAYLELTPDGWTITGNSGLT